MEQQPCTRQSPQPLLPHLIMPPHHEVRSSDVMARRLHGNLAAAADSRLNGTTLPLLRCRRRVAPGHPSARHSESAQGRTRQRALFRLIVLELSARQNIAHAKFRRLSAARMHDLIAPLETGARNAGYFVGYGDRGGVARLRCAKSNRPEDDKNCCRRSIGSRRNHPNVDGEGLCCR